MKAQQAARVCGKPIYVFRELVHHLEEQRLVAPGYSVMQTVVGQSITYEQNRLSTVVQRHLSETDTDALNRLLEDAPGLYEITQLKREPKDFSLSEIKREIHRGEQIQALYPIVSQAKFDETAFQWEHVDKLAPQFKRNLRPVLLSVEFATSSGHMPLMAAINFLKAAFQKGRSLTQYSTARFPTELIPDSTKRYLYASGEDDQKLLRDRYEFLVYRLLRNGLESGDVFCRDSVRFRSLEDDLIDEQRWQAKATLIATTGLSILTQPIRDHLAELEQRLSARITEVNQRLSAGENEHFELKKKGRKMRWTLHSPREA